MSRPLKIAITHTRFSYMGGVEKYIHSLVERLLAVGHEVHCLAAKWEDYSHPSLHFHKVRMWRFPQSLRVLSFNYFVNRILERETFDVVHGFTKTDTQDIYTDGSGCLVEFVAASRSHHSKVRRLLHLATPHQQAIWLMERRRFRRDAARRIVPVADLVRKQILARYDVDPGRVEVVYNGIELDYFHPDNRGRCGPQYREECGLPPDGAPLLLFVGNDWARKGLDVAIRALPKILGKTDRPPRLLVAGHDDHPERYRKLAQELGVAERITWLGSVREIRKPFSIADLFLFPSRYDAFGNVALEALASGVPALLSSRAGASEVFDESRGCMVLEDPDDPDELAKGALSYLEGGDLEACRLQARAIAERYSWDRHFERILEIYYEVVGEKERLFEAQEQSR